MPQKQVVTVFTKPACPQCDAVKRWLKSKNVDFETADAIENVQAIKEVLGFQQAPVTKIVNPDGTAVFFSGFNPNALEQEIVIPEAAAA